MLKEAGEGFVSLNVLWNPRRLPGEYCKIVYSIRLICGNLIKVLFTLMLVGYREIIKDH